MVKAKIKRQESTAPQAAGEVNVRKKRRCFFCDKKIDPSFTDSQTLRRFISDRSKIVPKMRTGTCSKHQRKVTKQIKYARHLSLLPFITSI